MSKFGDWFLRRPDGSTDELSVIEGTLNRVATSPDEFLSLLNQPDWQKDHLLSWHVGQLRERAIIPGPGQCVGFAPHPLITGAIQLDLAMVMPIAAWQTIAAQVVLGGSA